MGQSIKAWVGLAALVAVLIGAAAWFGYISPTRATIADTQANIDTEANRTITLNAALAKLKADFEGLDESLAKLDAVSVQIPSKADDSAFRRDIADRASTNGVIVMSLQTGVAVPVPQAAPAASTTTTASDAPTPSPSPAPDGTGAGAPSQTANGQVLLGIPLQMRIVGTYDAARNFIASMQTTQGRLFLIYSLNATSQPDSPASGGKPETFKGDVEISIEGYLVVLTESADGSTTTDVSPSGSPSPSPSPSPEPLPSTERNPFAPLPSAAPAS